MMTASIAMATRKFSGERMVLEYFERLYALDESTPIPPVPTPSKKALVVTVPGGDGARAGAPALETAAPEADPAAGGPIETGSPTGADHRRPAVARSFPLAAAEIA